MIRLWLLVAMMAIILAVVAKQWQVALVVIGIGMFIESDHDRVHHPGKGMSHIAFQIGGAVLAVIGALSFRL